MDDRSSAALRLLCAAVAMATIAPVAAEAQGIMGRVKRQAAETLGVPGGAGGQGTTRSQFPPGFSNPDYEITEQRLQLILAVAPRLAAEAEAADEKRERERAEEERRRDRARREEARISAQNRPHAECVLQAGNDMQRIMAEGNSERARKLMELHQKMAMLASEAAQKMHTRSDSAAYMRANYAVMDEMLAVIGRSCGPAPTEFLSRDDESSSSNSGADDSSSPDYVTRFLRETKLESRQWGVIRDKLIAYYSASRNNRELAGFSEAEKTALSNHRAALQQNEQALTRGSQW